MDERDPSELSDRLEREADDLQHRSEALQQDVSKVRQDWERKRADGGLPGANPPESESEEGAAEKDLEPDGFSEMHDPNRSRGRSASR